MDIQTADRQFLGLKSSPAFSHPLQKGFGQQPGIAPFSLGTSVYDQDIHLFRPFQPLDATLCPVDIHLHIPASIVYGHLPVNCFFWIV